MSNYLLCLFIYPPKHTKYTETAYALKMKKCFKNQNYIIFLKCEINFLIFLCYKSNFVFVNILLDNWGFFFYHESYIFK